MTANYSDVLTGKTKIYQAQLKTTASGDVMATIHRTDAYGESWNNHYYVWGFWSKTRRVRHLARIRKIQDLLLEASES